MSDPIRSPKHYTYGTIEPIEVINDWDLRYAAGCALKYIARHRHKGTPIEDLEKAAFYLEGLADATHRTRRTSYGMNVTLYPLEVAKDWDLEPNLAEAIGHIFRWEMGERLEEGEKNRAIQLIEREIVLVRNALELAR